MTVKLSPILNEQQFDANGDPLVGGKIYTYAAGSSTPQTSFTAEDGLTPQANPIILNARGEVDNPIWLTAGLSYKLVLTDADDVVIRTIDDVTGVNDTGVTTSQWVDSGVTPTYVNATQFTLPGDQTNAFQVNRRVKCTVTAGTVYGYISVSAFAALTTVTVVLDSGTLDSGLSAVQLGLITPEDTSLFEIQTANIADGILSADVAGRAKMADGYVTNVKLAFDGGSFGIRNRLINPLGSIYQIAVAATADDTYFADGWYMLTQTNTVTPSKLSDPEDGFLNGIRVTQSQASAQRFGFAQIIESVNCKDMRGGSVVMVPRIRASASQAIRYAILGWTSTADTVTSDVVNDWTSASYTAGGFFLGANISVIAVGSQTPSANTWTSLTALTAAAGSTFNNLIVMVWTEGTAAQNFTLDFDYVQLEKGATFTAFEFRDFEKEINLCQRYFEKSYDLTVNPGTVTSSGAESFIGNANGTTGARGQGGIRYKTRKRAAPSITLYSPDTGTSGSIYDQTGTADRASNANIIGETGFTINPSALSVDGRWRAHWIADSRL